MRDDQEPEERPDAGADPGPAPPPASPVGAEDRDVLDVPEWVSEFRRLYVEPKTREALQEQSGRAGRRPVPPAVTSRGAAAGAGEPPEQPLADEPLRSRSEMQRERRSSRGDRSSRRDESGPPTRPPVDPGTGPSAPGSRAARRRAREERARAERRMRLRRTVVVGMLLLVVAAVVTWLVASNREPVSASPAALVQPVAAAATTPAAASGHAPAASPAAAAITADGDSGTPGGQAQVLVRRDTTEPETSPERSARRPEADRARPRVTPVPSPSPTASPVARGTGSFSWVDWGSVPGARASGGTPLRVALELERGLGLDEAETASAVAKILVDERGWQTERDVRFVFVSVEQARRGEYDTRIGIASRGTTTDLCAPLDTEGYTSCYNGRVVVNLDRWMLGVDAYDGRLDEYRTYVVDHEVGHALGLGHASCPAEGAPAPVMVPQTLHLWGCAPNPYPVVG